MEAAFPNVSAAPVGVSRLRCAPQEYSFPSVTALRSTRPGGGRGRRLHRTRHAPQNTASPTDQHVVSTEGPLRPEVERPPRDQQFRRLLARPWRHLRGVGVSDRIRQVHGGVSTLLALRSTRPVAGGGSISLRNQRRLDRRPDPCRDRVERPPRDQRFRWLLARPWRCLRRGGVSGRIRQDRGGVSTALRFARHDQWLAREACPRESHLVSTPLALRSTRPVAGEGSVFPRKPPRLVSSALRSTRPRGGRGRRVPKNKPPPYEPTSSRPHTAVSHALARETAIDRNRSGPQPPCGPHPHGS